MIRSARAGDHLCSGRTLRAFGAKFFDPRQTIGLLLRRKDVTEPGRSMPSQRRAHDFVAASVPVGLGTTNAAGRAGGLQGESSCLSHLFLFVLYCTAPTTVLNLRTC